MQMLILMEEKVHTAALARAAAVGAATDVSATALNAPLEQEVRFWIDRIWDQTESALRHAWRRGLEAARPFIAKAEELRAEALAQLKQRAEAVWLTIQERLESYVQDVIDGALLRVKPAIVVGGQEMKLLKVGLEQRLMMSTSLKASLEGICELIGEGELSISAEYEAKR